LRSHGTRHSPYRLGVAMDGIALVYSTVISVGDWMVPAAKRVLSCECETRVIRLGAFAQGRSRMERMPCLL
jgi:hypothetical protein